MPLAVNVKQLWAIETMGARPLLNAYIHAVKAGESYDWQAALRKQYHHLARERHPDHGGSDWAMRDLNTAWEILRNIQLQPKRRRTT